MNILRCRLANHRGHIEPFYNYDDDLTFLINDAGVMKLMIDIQRNIGQPRGYKEPDDDHNENDYEGDG